MILRPARGSDQDELDQFEVGPATDQWLLEVQEIVAQGDQSASTEITKTAAKPLVGALFIAVVLGLLMGPLGLPAETN